MKTTIAFIVILTIALVGYVAFVQPVAAPTAEESLVENPANTETAAKIDINVVCDGALAYMTFQSGAEAEAFVEACKRGEHPEVIDQWKVQMGITDDRAI